MVINSSLNGSTIDQNISQVEPGSPEWKRDVLTNDLRKGVVTITFTKKDGTDRVMKCTLQEGVAIPYEKKTERTREGNIDILPVWDVEADGWRSVTISTIKEVNVNDVR